MAGWLDGVRRIVGSMRSWTLLRWVTTAIASLAAALVIGVPTGIVRTPFYTRMTPVLWWNYPIWVASSLLAGLVVATYVRSMSGNGGSGAKLGAGGGVLSLLAVGCPVCNKLVVLAIGVTGALNVWAPVQPILGLLSVGLLLWALARRLRGEVACPTPLRR